LVREPTPEEVLRQSRVSTDTPASIGVCCYFPKVREVTHTSHKSRRLPALQISEAFAKGKISYSKVRALSRVANPANEDYLLMIARHGDVENVAGGDGRIIHRCGNG
jgi:hypothetical protein